MDATITHMRREACGFYDLLHIAWSSQVWIPENEHDALCDVATTCQRYLNTTPNTIYATAAHEAFTRACEAFLECNP